MTMTDDKERYERLRALKDGGGYGILCILQRPGDVPFAVSPVPELVGYEICAAPEGLYDIWKDGSLVISGQTTQQIKDWIKEKTPVWLCDNSETTEDQKRLVADWVKLFAERYQLEYGFENKN